MDYKVNEISTKIISIEEDGYLSFAIKATVENLSSDNEVTVELQGIDKDGFEILHIYLLGHISLDQKKVLTTKESVEASLFKQVTFWQAK